MITPLENTDTSATRPADSPPREDSSPRPTDRQHPLKQLDSTEQRGAVVERLGRGDERTLAELVRRYEPQMIKLALKYVRNPATAEEVVQETWLVVVRDIDRFEGRGPVKNWIYAILVNLAKARGVRDARVIPLQFSEERRAELGEVPLATMRHRAGGRAEERLSYPVQLGRSVHDAASDRETMAAVVSAIKALPVNLRAVIYLRDVRGLAPEEACAILAISDGAQRVQLHRARRRVCEAVRDHLDRTRTQPAFAEAIRGGACG